ncbi:MoaD/ThiS family protein [Euzebya tangerina]|uniref:MoaD/ThiS family protein n=1 Tax=Euzebya tangerina TaxID=591198 RepID=UPI00196B8859|nr:MoaD/ThiS family protein [Euzebya tangerina]
MTAIRVVLPHHLRTLAGVDREITVEVEEPTIGGVLGAVEHAHPELRGTFRDHGTLKRRPFMRWFACEEDLSHEPLETRLPADVAEGRDVFRILGAIAGG